VQDIVTSGSQWLVPVGKFVSLEIFRGGLRIRWGVAELE
jgi:hypothetical protein